MPSAERTGFSIGARLAATTTLVVAVAAALLAFELTASERVRLIDSKKQAAQMLVALEAAALSAPLDFGDAEDIRGQLDNLKTNEAISSASVWAPGATSPLAEWHRAEAENAAPPAEGIDVEPSRMVIVRTVPARTGATLGLVRIGFSLAAENAEYETVRLRILLGAGGVAIAIAGLLVVLARLQIVRPLRRLADAVRALERGEPSVTADIDSRDEIGELAHAFNSMGKAVVYRQQRLAREIELAEQIQRSILPLTLAVDGLDLSATMLPATEVGGDYYDVLPDASGCWLGIGDVTGHGLNAGLTMLMIQSMVSVLVRRNADATPSEVFSAVNTALYDNVRDRLRREDHATLTLLRYRTDGRVTFAGAHEDILVYRAATGTCELIATSGTWAAGVRDVSRVTADEALRLGDGDILVLYTDGVTEAQSSSGEMFGIDRLVEALRTNAGGTVDEIRDSLVQRINDWTAVQNDDVTLLIARYRARRSDGEPSAP